VFTNLINGTVYTFAIVATNGPGTGPAASAAPVTPQCDQITSGLSISGGAPGSFGSVSLNGGDTTVYASLGSYQATNITCSGWNITMQATPFTGPNGDQLPAGSLVMPAPSVSSCQSSCGQGAAATGPSVCLGSGTAALDAGAVTVASAPSGNGEGAYTFTPGTIGGISGHNLQLSVPAFAYAGTYGSTLTISMVQGPTSGTC
jgi:hypothetical protein